MFRKEEKKRGGEFCAKPPSDGLIVSCVLQLNLFHFVCTTIQIYEKNIYTIKFNQLINISKASILG